jgi:hypothetical protein
MEVCKQKNKIAKLIIKKYQVMRNTSLFKPIKSWFISKKGADKPFAESHDDEVYEKRVVKQVIENPGNNEPEEVTKAEMEPASILQNHPFIKLVEECIDIMNEFDGYTNRLETEEGRLLAKLVVRHLQESLERSGLSRIENEETFSILRHIPVPMTLVADGEPLEKTVMSGLSIENRVFRKAKVVVKVVKKENSNEM